MFNQTILTPSEFVEWVNQTLEYAYPEVVLEGEVSGFSVNQNKFVFFDIKDESTAVSCFMMVWQLATQIEDGMQIRISARPKITNKGKFSLTVSKLQPIGEGDIKKAQLLLQQKLAKEGLFNSDRKRPVPQFPKKIGLISSKTAAGAKDFLTILENRWLGEVLFVNTNVQGENAGDQLVASIQYFNELNVPCDVVVMVRGGGSIEDLLPFSLEPVVRAVATSRTPMIVGIGHEQDVSLAELAADLRAATPTHAAQLVCPDKKDLADGLEITVQKLKSKIDSLIGGELTALKIRLGNAMRRKLESTDQYLRSLKRTLISYDPNTALKRGYSLTRINGKLLSTVDLANPGDTMLTQVNDGKIESEVKSVKKNRD